MSNLSFIGNYKDKVIKLLLNNKDIVKLINPIVDDEYSDIIDVNDVLLGGEWNIGNEMHYESGHIFDYDFVEDKMTDEKTFIFVEVFVDNVYETVYTNFKLCICVFSHKSLVKLGKSTFPTKSEMQVKGYNGNRIDMLCDAIDGTLNGNEDLGIGKLHPSMYQHIMEYIPNPRYYGKVISYTVKNYYDGSKGDCNAK